MGHLEVGSTDHFEGISASPIRGQARAEMARIHHRSPTMETLTLTQKEQARLQVLNSLLAEQMTLDQAATLMGVSARHTRHILAAYRREGAAALAHGNRGLRSTNATPEPLRSEVLRLAQTRYPDANHTHLSELLREREGIEIGRTTLRRILTGAGSASGRRSSCSWATGTTPTGTGTAMRPPRSTGTATTTRPRSRSRRCSPGRSSWPRSW